MGRKYENGRKRGSQSTDRKRMEKEEDVKEQKQKDGKQKMEE